MKLSIIAGLAALLAGATGAVAFAEEWKDYNPVKGAYEKTLVHVDPDKIDDYLVALRKTWIPEMEMLKKRGLIDTYMVQVNANPYGAGPNVVLIQHFPALSGMEPDRERDMAMDREYESILPKAQAPAVMADRAKYRTILSQELWTTVDFPK